MADAIVLREPGGPEVLRLETVEVGAPGPGEVRLRQTAVGVNFHDCYVRSGSYQTLRLPGIPGLEAAGEVIEAGPDVEGFAVGDRVAYFTGAYGGYAAERVIAARHLVKLPPTVGDAVAATLMVKGLTAQLLVRQAHAVQAGQTVLAHAAAGGVGTLLCQWAKHLGARVIGTVGSREKAAAARAAGCDDVILYRDEDFVERTRMLTEGRGVDVVYDAVGRDTFYGSLDCLAPRGRLVNYGQASGPVEPLAMQALSRGSFSVVRPMLFHYAATRDELDAMADDLFSLIENGVLDAPAPAELPLADAAEAHRRLEARETTGALILRP